MPAEIVWDMPETEYHQLQRLSATHLKTAATRSLADLKKYYEGEGPTSEGYWMGWLCHLKANCPQEWDKRVVYPPSSLTEGILTSDGKESKRPTQTLEYARRYNEWEESQDRGAICVSEKDYLEAERITAALTESECYAECDAVEVVVLFDFFGEPAKCRIDGVKQVDGTLYDLYDWKFVKDTRKFWQDIWNYCYHIQTGFYEYGWKQAGMDCRHFCLVGVDKKRADPNYTVCAPMKEEDQQLGVDEALYWLGRIREARQTGVWPGAESPDYWSRPAWYRSPLDLRTLETTEWTP